MIFYKLIIFFCFFISCIPISKAGEYANVKLQYQSNGKFIDTGFKIKIWANQIKVPSFIKNGSLYFLKKKVKDSDRVVIKVWINGVYFASAEVSGCMLNGQWIIGKEFSPFSNEHACFFQPEELEKAKSIKYIEFNPGNNLVGVVSVSLEQAAPTK